MKDSVEKSSKKGGGEDQNYKNKILQERSIKKK